MKGINNTNLQPINRLLNTDWKKHIIIHVKTIQQHGCV